MKYGLLNENDVKTSTEFTIVYLRAIALNLGKYAGDPGGVSVLNRASSLTPRLTVMVCLKSNGKEICPGSRFND